MELSHIYLAVSDLAQQAISQDFTGQMNHSNCCLNAYYQDLDQHFGIQLQNITSRIVLTYTGFSKIFILCISIRKTLYLCTTL